MGKLQARASQSAKRNRTGGLFRHRPLEVLSSTSKSDSFQCREVTAARDLVLTMFNPSEYASSASSLHEMGMMLHLCLHLEAWK